MHRVINQTPIGLVTDHINKNRLDNRKINLRTLTQQINLRNRGKFKNSTSKFTGVSLDTNSKLWRARICINYQDISIGYFKTEIEAHRAYKNYVANL